MIKKFQWENVHYFESVDSTNNVVKLMAEEGAEHGTVVVADVQTAGRGRIGREWTSPKNGGIWMSVLLRPDIRPENASRLTLVAAMAVRETLAKKTGVDCWIKWPNDIVTNGKKICGILTEMKSQAGEVNYIVVGIGINVNIERFPEELTETASSLYIETGRSFERSEIIEEFGKSFAKYYDIFMLTQDMSVLMMEYNNCLANYNNKVKILDTRNTYTGVSEGINEAGELLVRDETGNMNVVRTGEVSVRGIYGYV